MGDKLIRTMLAFVTGTLFGSLILGQTGCAAGPKFTRSEDLDLTHNTPCICLWDVHDSSFYCMGSHTAQKWLEKQMEPPPYEPDVHQL